MSMELNRRRARLLARIGRRYETVTEVHALGPLRLRFQRISDPDVVLDQIVEEEDRREKVTGERRDGNELHLPYWAELWDSAIGIGHYVAEHYGKLTRPQADVLELGCGMGFTGMVAAVMGAKVLFADIEPEALLFAQLNSMQWADRTRTRRVNWQTDRLGETFDLIIGSDVLYDKTQWEYLEPFFRAHLRENGTVLLGEPGRQTGELFPTWIEARGWAIDTVLQRVATQERPIRIFRVRRADKN